MEDLEITDKDVLVGITASGGAPYVLGAAEAAKARGAVCIALVNNPGSKLETLCDVTVAPVVGPEVIMGSTRMKAGTAEKLVLNMLSTAVMIKSGKVYNNLMVDLRATNRKLQDRSVRIITAATGAGREEAEEYLRLAGGKVKTAIMMYFSGLEASEAERALDARGGKLKQALKDISVAYG